MGLFAFTAAATFLAVNVVDPYSGATASPYYENVPVYPVTDAGMAQTISFGGEYSNELGRDGYDVALAPKPPKDEAGGDAPVLESGSPREIARQIVLARGWGEEQYRCLDKLWQKESNWRVNAENRSSGAYGIPQALPGRKMASAGADWQTNPATQITWGLGYISGRYGTPCGAWGHSQAVNWY